MRSFIIVLLLCVIGGAKVFAQETKFTASAPSVVEVGEQFRLSFVLNKQGENLQVPTLQGFDLLAGPSLSTSFNTSIINGKMEQSSEYTYTYVLEAREEGEYTVAPATITVDGKEYKSSPLKIKVIKGSDKPKGNNNASSSGIREDRGSSTITDDDLFLRMEVSRNSLYVGESLTATLKVYARVNLVDVQGKKIPPFDGFLTEDVKIPQIRLEREEYNGKIYDRVGVLQKTILFPQHAGTLTIDPYELICVVRQRVAGRSNSIFDDFFGQSRDVRVICKSKPVKITVKPLPEAGKPLGFSGMVGTLAMTTSTSTDTLRANDALTYKVVLRGTGNMKLLEAPKISFPHDFDVYDPKVIKDINGTSGTVTFEYLVIPRYAGEYKIPAVQYSYFDPQSGTYKILTGKEYTVRVAKGNESGQGTGEAALQSFKKEDVRMLGQDIRYIKTGKSDLRQRGVQYFATMEYWLSFLIPFVLFVVGMILNRRRIKANADLVRVKSKTANKMAQKRLRAASVAMKAGNSELFYQEVLNALWGYVSYKLNISASELNRDNISEHLTRRGADTTLIQGFIEVLDHCEYARYAPGANQDEEMDKVYKDSLSIIMKLDKAI
ncbi:MULTISPECIES: BatD family protein [Odoribacteraceae]|uniref:BatD family protein n=1 Tax=Odoribacteraceae TaxID=1853231 RepID=UPI000E540E03|nr:MULTISPECIES: BatD family protein [Odoribacteraceae]MCQ4875440.1 BatD family protein [Butyricimonas paravirosa]RHR80367.1 protein BatD [Odoribacter sp. AF15-53]